MDSQIAVCRTREVYKLLHKLVPPPHPKKHFIIDSFFHKNLLTHANTPLIEEPKAAAAVTFCACTGKAILSLMIVPKQVGLH